MIENPAIPRDSNGKPRAFDSRPEVIEKNLPEAKYGVHQYSNLGYQLLGLAMEIAYDLKENQTGENAIKDYKQLTREFLLKPAEEGKIKFGDTKFPEDLQAVDNVARASWLEKSAENPEGKFVDVTQFNGANAAGGIFTSANDSVKFFNEFFRGFPGTKEYGQEGANQFFSVGTIDSMVREGSKKFGECGVNNSKTARNGNLRYQGPGFGFEVDKSSGEIISYEKSGGTFGYASFLSFNPQLGETMIDMCAQENVSDAIAQNLGVELKNLTGNGEFDRHKLIAENRPDLLQRGEGFDFSALTSEVREAMQGVAEAIASNAASSEPQTSSVANGGTQVTRSSFSNGRS